MKLAILSDFKTLYLILFALFTWSCNPSLSNDSLLEIAFLRTLTTSPSNLSVSYSETDYTYNVGEAIHIAPSSANVTSFSISPDLPTGLYFDTATGVISGTASEELTTTGYTITARDSKTSIELQINLTIKTAPTPLSLSFSTSYELLNGTQITITPTLTGTATACSASPSLPTGLILDNSTCSISGTPSEDQTATNYSITVSNEAYSTTANFSLSIKTLYSIGGSISGLSGTIVIQNNNGDDTSLTTNGNFSFPTQINGEYSVSIKTQPFQQTCTISNGSGTTSETVSDVIISCVTNSYQIGGSLTGMASSKSIIIQLNAANDLTLTANGSFAFSTMLNYNASYAITVKTNPTSQACSVINSTGTVSDTISNIIISCTPYMEPKTWYVDNGNNTIYDKSTNLTWMKCSMSKSPGMPLTGSDCNTGEIGVFKYCGENDNDCNGGAVDDSYGSLITTGFSNTYPGSYGSIYSILSNEHYTAFKACNDANSIPSGGFTGKTGWRIPTVNELRTLLDLSGQNYSSTGALINGTFFPNTNSTGFYWSSTAYAPTLQATKAWAVSFGSSNTSILSKTFLSHVRCVRSGL